MEQIGFTAKDQRQSLQKSSKECEYSIRGLLFAYNFTNKFGESFKGTR